MAIFFEKKLGVVVRFDDPAVQGSLRLVELDDAPIDFNIERSIITRVVVSERVNAQFLHTIGADIYVYVFGDRIGNVVISGLAFASSCHGGEGADDRHGAERILKWYRKHRLSRRKEPIRILIGNTPIEGFMMEFNEDVADSSTTMMQWTVVLQALPEALTVEDTPGAIEEEDSGGGGDFGSPDIDTGGGGDWSSDEDIPGRGQTFTPAGIDAGEAKSAGLVGPASQNGSFFDSVAQAARDALGLATSSPGTTNSSINASKFPATVGLDRPSAFTTGDFTAEGELVTAGVVEPVKPAPTKQAAIDAGAAKFAGKAK